MSIKEKKWKLFDLKNRYLLIWGLKHGKISLYDDELIEKLRDIYYGCIPASIILLSNYMSNGYCYDRALLLSRAFLDTEDDVNLIYAAVDSLKYNPKYDYKKNPMSADHCIVERITKDGKHYIYDTSMGFVYDKDYYFFMEHPKIRHINNKEAIKKFIEEDDFNDYDEERDKYATPLILPNIESTYNEPREMYSLLDNNMLKREIELFKTKIEYENICYEIEEDMKVKGFK